jgi:hypothetical protein
VEHGTAPVLTESRDIRHLVLHPGRQDQRARPDLIAVAGRHDESLALGARVDRLGIADRDRVIGGELLARP